MLAYTALRLAAIEALSGATIANDRVYDSRQFALDAVDEDMIDGGPSLCVYTEEGDGEPFGSGKIHPSDVHVWLTVEAVVLAREEFEVELADGTTRVIAGGAVALTDRVHEGLVDILVAQVRRRLSIDAAVDHDPAACLFREVRRGVIRSEDTPQRSADKAVRFAGRTLRFHVALRSADRWSASGGALPDPLAAIADRLTVPSSLALIGELQQLAPAPPTAPGAAPLEVRLDVGVGRAPDPADVAAKAP